jgi:hypothetical protein
MQATKHDLSANEVRLDYAALVTTAEIAVGKSKSEISHYVIKITNNWSEKEFGSMKLNAGYLKEEAERLEIACETLATLKCGETRKNIIIVNKKEIQE